MSIGLAVGRRESRPIVDGQNTPRIPMYLSESTLEQPKLNTERVSPPGSYGARVGG